MSPKPVVRNHVIIKWHVTVLCKFIKSPILWITSLFCLKSYISCANDISWQLFHSSCLDSDISLMATKGQSLLWPILKLNCIRFKQFKWWEICITQESHLLSNNNSLPLHLWPSTLTSHKDMFNDSTNAVIDWQWSIISASLCCIDPRTRSVSFSISLSCRSCNMLWPCHGYKWHIHLLNHSKCHLSDWNRGNRGAENGLG